ncbi:MAG: hypothetical protein H6842_12540 [Rhodospirillaceae bacterium]|nr:hypothetical protein [Rhodospirillaceae bacterium]
MARRYPAAQVMQEVGGADVLAICDNWNASNVFIAAFRVSLLSKRQNGRGPLHGDIVVVGPSQATIVLDQ